jgi:uncharacterized protein (DUF3084 family)
MPSTSSKAHANKEVEVRWTRVNDDKRLFYREGKGKGTEEVNSEQLSLCRITQEGTRLVCRRRRRAGLLTIEWAAQDSECQARQYKSPLVIAWLRLPLLK